MNVVKKGWRQEMPAFLHFMEESLNLPVRLHDEALGYHLYLVDLSGWKLRFSDRTPLICVTEADLAALPVRELAQSLADVIRTRNLEDRHPILLVQGSGEGLRSFLRTALVPALVLDHAGQTAVQMSRRPSGELLDRLSAQLDLSALAPYETSKPVTGSRFFGREFEVRRILQSPESNFAIMGIRRIGKTSLMREVERQLHDQALETGEETAQERIQFMDCSALSSPEDFMREVVRRLRAQELPRLSNRQYPIYFPDFLKRMAQRTGGRLVFFLDEFDKVLAWHHERRLAAQCPARIQHRGRHALHRGWLPRSHARLQRPRLAALQLCAAPVPEGVQPRADRHYGPRTAGKPGRSLRAPQ